MAPAARAECAKELDDSFSDVTCRGAGLSEASMTCRLLPAVTNGQGMMRSAPPGRLVRTRTTHEVPARHALPFRSPEERAFCRPAQTPLF